MAKAKTPAAIDTSAGTTAYNLAVLHKAELDPRLPSGTVANLAADLTTLGANPTPAPSTPAAPPPPPLAQALAAAVTLMTAIHAAVAGAKPKSDVRKAYGASSKTPAKEAKVVVADGQKIVTRAQANPTEALSLGILPSDVAALSQALADLSAAETAAMGGAAAGSTGKERRAAETRMHEAVARIGGAGVLAFATNAAVRADFAALSAKKSAS